MKDLSLIYEVNIKIPSQIKDDYLSWLKHHIDEILQIDGFLSASFFEDESHEGYLQYCVQYQVLSQEKLDHYLKDFAPKMRSDGVQKFGTKVKITRRILKPLTL